MLHRHPSSTEDVPAPRVVPRSRLLFRSGEDALTIIDPVANYVVSRTSEPALEVDKRITGVQEAHARGRQSKGDLAQLALRIDAAVKA